MLCYNQLQKHTDEGRKPGTEENHSDKEKKKKETEKLISLNCLVTAINFILYTHYKESQEHSDEDRKPAAEENSNDKKKEGREIEKLISPNCLVIPH